MWDQQSDAVNKLPFLQIIQWQYGKIVVIYNVVRNWEGTLIKIPPPMRPYFLI